MRICDETGITFIVEKIYKFAPDFLGLFQCEGKYNQMECCFPKEHIINPYQSAEVRCGGLYAMRGDWM